jgi:DNA-binding FrmR family transcriptional regulator
MNLPKGLTKGTIARLKSIEGQVRGLSTMLENDNEPEKVLIQFKAVWKALDKLHFILLDEVYRKTLAINIVETMNACPGNCGNEDRIEFIRKNFPNLETDDLSQKMKEITELKKLTEVHNEQP